MIPYKVFEDSENYQSFHLEAYDLVELLEPHIGEETAMFLGFSDTRVEKFWKPLDISYFQNEGTMSMPDIGETTGGLLVLNEKAHGVLVDLFERHGEFLAGKLQGKPCYIYHCLNFKEIEGSQITYEIHGDIHAGVKSLVFPSSLKDHFFKAKNKVTFDTFVSSEVVSRISEAGLKGLRFNSDLARMIY